MARKAWALIGRGRKIPTSPARAGRPPVTVGKGETSGTIARNHAVPASAVMQTNGISNAASIKPGQRLVIPRYVSGSAPVAQASNNAPTNKKVYVVQPGENLTGIARRHGVAVAVVARANNIQPYAKVNAGDRLTIPGGR